MKKRPPENSAVSSLVPDVMEDSGLSMLYFLGKWLILILLVNAAGCSAMFNAKPIPGVPQPEDRIHQIRELGANAELVPDEQKEQYARTLSTLVREETDCVMRREAVLAISRFKVPITADTLRAAAKDPDRDVRESLCTAWQNYGGETAVTEIIQILGNDSDLDVRHAAIEALGNLKDERAIVALEVPLVDTDPALRHYTVQALQKITGLSTTDHAEWVAYCQARHPDTAVAYQEPKKKKEFKSPLLNLLPQKKEEIEVPEAISNEESSDLKPKKKRNS